MLFGLTYPVQRLFDLQAKAVDVETEIAVLQLRTQYLKFDTDLLEHRKDASISESQTLQSKARDAEIKTQQVAGEHKKLRLLTSQSLFLLLVSGISALVGLRLAYSGFKNWYLWVQKPSDLAIANRMSGTTPGNSVKPKPLRGST